MVLRAVDRAHGEIDRPDLLGNLRGLLYVPGAGIQIERLELVASYLYSFLIRRCFARSDERADLRQRLARFRANVDIVCIGPVCFVDIDFDDMAFATPHFDGKTCRRVNAA